MAIQTHKPLHVTLTGVSPMIQHNGQLADSLNPITREMKRLTSKKKKTDEDQAALSKLEWYGGLYVDGDLTTDNGNIMADDAARIVVDGLAIESMLVKAGKKAKNGDAFKAGLLCDGLFPLEYSGPQNINELFNAGKHVLRRGVVVMGKRIIRTRPMFREWKLKLKVQYLPSVLNDNEIYEAFETAGTIVGLLDYRPRFGRFTVERA